MMRDVVFVLSVIVFFTLAVAYVRVCAWVVGVEAQANCDPAGDEREVAA
jgi:hypothetical protein